MCRINHITFMVLIEVMLVLKVIRKVINYIEVLVQVLKSIVFKNDEDFKIMCQYKLKFYALIR
jgi:hypothetical protein